MRVMGIDPSTKCGYAVLGPTKAGTPRTWTAGEIPGTAVKGLERARKIASNVTAVAIQNAPELIVIEGYAMGNRFTLVTLVEIGTLIRDRLWKDGFKVVVVAPTQLKKFVLGKGVGKKDQMRLGTFKRWGFENDSDNAVDAYGLACIGLALLGQLPGLIAPQVEVISKLPQPEGAAFPRRVS